MTGITRRRALAAALAPLAMPGLAQGAWPQRTVRYIELFQPGSGPDIAMS